jgi:hypothetical protein
VKTFSLTIEASDADDLIRALELALAECKANRDAIEEMCVDDLIGLNTNPLISDLCRHA